MSKRTRKPKPAPLEPQAGIRLSPFQLKVRKFDPPIPVQVGDQVVTEFDLYGRPLFKKIIRDGKQIWPDEQQQH